MSNGEKISTEKAVELVCQWLKDDGCVPFLGAAFSARKAGDPDGDGVPSTNEMLKALNSAESSLARALDQFGDPPNGMLAAFLTEQFKDAKPKRCHHLAARLPFRTVITTNCDDLMERAYTNIWKDEVSVVLDEDLCRVGSSDVTVAKPHGCIREAVKNEAALVFTSSQYATFKYHRPMLTRWLAAILATHHVIYLGYGLEDPDVLKAILHGLDVGNSLRRAPKPLSLAVLGPGERTNFASFERYFGCEEPEKKADRRDRSDLIQEVLQTAPKQFMRNCCLAALRDTFPVSLIQWHLRPDEVPEAKKYFAKFFAAGLVEPVMKMGDQWYRLCTELKTKCEQRLSPNALTSIIDDYLRFLKVESDRLQKQKGGSAECSGPH
jgi:hypothetical protein